MGKRKASVLNNAESMNEWLGDSYHTPGQAEAGAVNPAPLGEGLDTVIAPELNYLTVVPAEGNMLDQLPLPVEAGPGCGLAKSSREGISAVGRGPLQISSEDVQATTTTEELDLGTEAAVEAFWALLAELGYEPI